MAGAKETPRQKMIGMMYLVLTALLALNVSKDILDAFVVVNDGLQKTKTNFRGKNAEKYASFNKAFEENQKKVGIYWNEALRVRVLTDDAVTYIDNIKAELIAKTEKLEDSQAMALDEFGRDTVLSLKYVEQKDNYMVPTRILIGQNPAKPRDDNDFTAKRLKLKLEDFRDQLANIILSQPTINKDNVIYRSLFKTFDFQDGKDASGLLQNWESLNFYDVPLAASITILSKLQTDVLNAESDVITYLFNRVDASSYKFTQLTSVVIPKSEYVFTGDTFRAEVFLAAYDPTQEPIVYISDQSYTSNDSTPLQKSNMENVEVRGSRGFVKIPANKTGDYFYKGMIEFKAPDGTPTFFPYNIYYEVALPTLTVAPIKMNVFYKGVDNPVSISAPGVSSDDLRPSISNGTISRSGSDWVVRVRQGTEAIITVNAQFADGSVKSMGKSNFRVKTVPDPVPSFAGKRPTDNRVKKSELNAAQGVIAKLDEFDFDMKFEITQFKVTMVFNGIPVDQLVKGNRVNKDMKAMFKKARKGQKVLIENIRAKGEDGTIRKLPPISLKVI
jgi:gliding motility-associated protein GldM